MNFIKIEKHIIEILMIILREEKIKSAKKKLEIFAKHFEQVIFHHLFSFEDNFREFRTSKMMNFPFIFKLLTEDFQLLWCMVTRRY